jgi:UDP-N-acetylmuramoylalanine--D-glutamate ligase
MNQQDPATLVVGLGKTGLSMARHLRAQGVEIAVTDSRMEPPGLQRLHEELPSVRAFVGGFPSQPFQRAGRLAVSPGVDLQHPLIKAAMDRGIEVIGDIELFARARKRPVVAVTGTNGKSTVTSLVGAMAEQAGRRVAVGGNLGTPALGLLGTGTRVPDFYVLELSSFQLELTRSLNAEIAALLNVSADHMDRHQTMENYIAIKERVFLGSGVAVFNPAEQAMRYMDIGQRQAHRFMMTPPQPGDFGVRRNNDKDWIARGGQALIAADELSLPGRHNLANALAALAIGEAIGLGLQPMLETLRSFPGLAHRTQLVASFAGIRWINDSKGTNVGATVAAVAGLDGPHILILGGDGKGQDFRPLAKALKGKVRNIVLMGRDAKTIANDLQGTVPKVTVPGMAEAVLEARRMARRGDTVLLSPACASQDQYRDYRQRGDDFAARVKALKQQHEGGV